MTVLVVGGAASGKSAYAEELLCKLSRDLPRTYIATMEPFGAEACERIEKHRAARQGRGFETIECYVNLAGLELPHTGAALLEDIGNLCANELFSPNGAGDGAAEAILRGMERLQDTCSVLVLVSNEVFAGGADYAGDTARYLSVLADVNRKLAARADAVCEIACGIPDYYKGEEPR